MKIQQQYEPSFRHYAEANRLRRGHLRYQAEYTTRFVRRSRALFTSEFLRERTGRGLSAPDPIFIVGLPRSGSTLVEQMLSSHPQVEGTMELADITIIARTLGRDSDVRRCGGGTAGYPR